MIEDETQYLVPRLEAAKTFGCSPKTFDLKIRPLLSETKIGRLVCFDSAEIRCLLIEIRKNKNVKNAD